MQIRVTNDLSDLVDDASRIAAEAVLDMSETVLKNVEAGKRYAKGIARREAGPHGENYYKRITSDMTGPLEGEFGPHGNVAGNAVGAGWRNGPPNTDLPKAAEIVGPRFGKDVGNLPDRWFW